MSAPVQDALNGPTYIVISRYSDGEVWLNETKLNSSLQDAIEDIDNTHQVIMLEDGKVFDVSVDAAELHWALHSHKYEDEWQVPQFIMGNISDVVIRDISESRYENSCWRQHILSCGPQL